MGATATLVRPALDDSLTPEMVRMLKFGAAHEYGYLVMLRSDSEKYGRELMELQRRGYQRWVGYDPMITEAGRAAIGAPTEREADAIRLQGYAKEHALLSVRREAKAKAEPHDPHGGCYWPWHESRLACVLVVKHWKPRDGAKSFAVSRDGGAPRPLYLPFSVVDQGLPESTDDFLLALVSHTWVDRIEKKDFVGAQPLRELFGITLPLTASQDWTDEQIETWKRLGKLRGSINFRIENATRPRKTYSKLPFGYTA